MAAPLVAAAGKALAKKLAQGAAKKAATSKGGQKLIKTGCMAAAGLVILPMFFLLAILSAIVTGAKPFLSASAPACSQPSVTNNQIAAGVLLNRKPPLTDRNKLIVMVAIAGAESGWQADQITGSRYGLWGISNANTQYWPPTQSNANWILDPDNNATAAIALAGGIGITTLQPWYGDAAYAAFKSAGGFPSGGGIKWSVAPNVTDSNNIFSDSVAAVDAAIADAKAPSGSSNPNAGCCPATGTTGSNGGASALVLARVRVIIGVAKARGIPQFGQAIAVAVARAESNFLNYANPAVPASMQPPYLPNEAVGHDHLSVGIYQQQPWWGPLAVLMDPAGSAGLFYSALLKVQGWTSLPLGVAAQKVQGSAISSGSNYQVYAAWATAIVAANQDAPPIQTTGGSYSGSGCSGTNGYVNPIKIATNGNFCSGGNPPWGLARTDQGVDYLPCKADVPVIAIGDGVITYESYNAGWPGFGGPNGLYMTYKLSNGPKAGYCIYVSENITNPLPQNTPFHAGDTIGLAQPGPSWNEWGWASCQPPGRYGGPVDRQGGCGIACPTVGGWMFTRFLNELGAKTLDHPPGPGPDMPPTPQG